MNHPFRLLVLGLSLAAPAIVPPAGAAAPGPAVFELRIYTTHPGKLDALLARFRDHTCALFEKHGVTNLGYWTPTDADKGAGAKLVFLLGHASRESAAASAAAFRADPAWIAARAASEADGPINASTESIFLAPTDYSGPHTTGPGPAGRVFELRTYKTLPGRLAKLDAHFRDHTCGIFAKHGMTNLGYYHPLDADKGAGDTLIYLLAHDSREAATASWAAFRVDPQWIAARDASEADGKINASVGSLFLRPTDFSPLK